MHATAKRTILGVAVIGLTALMVPTARAAGGVHNTVVRTWQSSSESNSAGDAIHGGCLLVSAEDPTIPGANDGVIGVAAVTTDPNLRPNQADVTCFVKVNGVPQWNTWRYFFVNSVTAAADTVTYQAYDWDFVELCEDVTYYPDGTTEPELCEPVDETQGPPQVVDDLLQSLYVSVVDPTLCPVLVDVHNTTGGGIQGVLYIASDGDVLIADPLALGLNPVEDCPPYGTTGA